MMTGVSGPDAEPGPRRTYPSSVSVNGNPEITGTLPNARRRRT
jgi:hypothetical protein